MGLSIIGSMALGMALVMGKNRDPQAGRENHRLFNGCRLILRRSMWMMRVWEILRFRDADDQNWRVPLPECFAVNDPVEQCVDLEKGAPKVREPGRLFWSLGMALHSPRMVRRHLR